MKSLLFSIFFSILSIDQVWPIVTLIPANIGGRKNLNVYLVESETTASNIAEARMKCGEKDSILAAFFNNTSKALAVTFGHWGATFKGKW